MKSVNIHEAKTHLCRLVEDAAAGEEVVMAKAGKPMARLVPIERPTARRLGSLRGRIRVPDDFDAPLPDEVLLAFEGETPAGAPLRDRHLPRQPRQDNTQ